MEKKEELKTPCKYCGRYGTYKNGKQNNKQRYYCMACRKYFTEERNRIGYTNREKKFLSMLLNFLRDNGDKGLTLKEAVEKIDIAFPEISKFRLKQSIKTSNDSVSCYNPRILICEDDKNIIIYRFQERTPEDGESREIKIKDSDEYKNIIYSDISY